LDPDFESVVTTLKSLHQFDSTVERLFDSMDRIILKPRLAFGKTTSPIQIHVNNRTIGISQSKMNLSLKDLFNDLDLVVHYINANLPPSISIPLSDRLVPRLITSLTNTWLPSAVPFGLAEMEEFKGALDMVQGFAQEMDSMGWDGKEDLYEWVDLAPRNWLTKQREMVLEKTRQELSRGLGRFKTVERVETQKISRQENMFTGAQDDENWNAGWSDEEEEKEEKEEKKERENHRDEDDTGAWGFEDENHEINAVEKKATDEDNDDGAWGWGDEEGQDPSHFSVNGHGSRGEVEREVTLRETYSITSLPEAILSIINQIISDADTLSSPQSSNSPVSPALSGLFLLPTLVLAMYRAAAPMHYAKNPIGSMY
jgi:centromere/kinetochore protein ZW10